MKPAHKSNAGQIVNNDEKMQLLSDYIKQVQTQETPPKQPKTFDEWLDEFLYMFISDTGNEVVTRRKSWEPAEIEAARLAWEEARK